MPLGSKLALKELAKRELKKRGLDMSQAGRMGRAAEQGRNPGYFHGTTSGDIDELKISTGGEIGPGVYVTRSPIQGSEYARHSFGGDYPEGSNVMPLNVRGDLKPMNREDWVNRRAELMDEVRADRGGEWDGSMFDEAQRRLNQEVIDEGYTGIYFNNPTGEESFMYDQGVVFDPANIRSVNAAFDPEKADSPNLLAGLQGAAPYAGGAALAAGALAPEQAQAQEAYAKYAMPSGQRIDGPQPQGPPTQPEERSFIDHSIGELDLLGSVASGLGHSALGGLSGLGGLLLGNGLDESVEDVRTFEGMNNYELGEEGQKTLQSLVDQYGESHPLVQQFFSEYMKSGDYWGDKAFEATEKVYPPAAPAIGTGVKLGFDVLQ